MCPQIPITIVIIIINFCSHVSADYALNDNETQPVYTFDDIYNENKESTDDRYVERCYGIYGCFPVDFPWKSEQRAQSVFPFSPVVLQVKFPLFTNKTRTAPTLLDINDLSNIHSLKINKNKKIYFIAHGFLELGVSKWLIQLMNEILDFDNEATVVIVDWRHGSSPPYYQAVANIRVVGVIEAHMIMGLALELELENLENFHLIGHSLGSHVSGYAGYHLYRDFGMKAGRITGLDPAKPYFEFTPPIVRLDPSDAKFVDIIHTDSATFQEKSFGLKQPIGHLDFYPNGGRNQPFCDDKPLDATCSHKTAFELFTESVNSKCPFMAISCESYEEFLVGKCSKCENGDNSCIKFGFHAKNPEPVGKFSKTPFYFLTSSSPPYCKVHYKISIKISGNASGEVSSEERNVGTLDIRLISSSNKKSEKISLTKTEMNFQAGKSYSFLVTSDDIGSTVQALRILYSYKFHWIMLKNPEIFVDFIEIHSMEYGSTQKLCTKDNQSLVNGYISELRENYC